MCSKYNGWSNYETWDMNIWLDNDSSFDEVANDAINVIISDDYSDSEDEPMQIDKDDLVYKTQMWLQEWAEEMWMEPFESCDFNHSYGPIGDITKAAWSLIDWTEIAGHLVDSWIYEQKSKGNNLEVADAVLG
jgi:hypothetical protein